MEVLAGGALSLLVGLGLWAVLPRGVVLTREYKTYPPGVEPQRAEWTIRNASALPVRLTKVVRSGIDTFDPNTLTAHVNLNRTLTIKYRRAGWFGVFERRSVRIDGGT